MVTITFHQNDVPRNDKKKTKRENGKLGNKNKTNLTNTSSIKTKKNDWLIAVECPVANIS